MTLIHCLTFVACLLMGVSVASVIGVLAAAPAVTTLNLNFVPEYILVGDVATAVPLSAVNWSINGTNFATIAGATIIQAVTELGNAGLLGATVSVGQVFQIADGGMGSQTFQINLTNSGATTPNILAFDTQRSKRIGGKYQMITLVASTSVSLSGFAALFFDATHITQGVFSFVGADGQEWTSVLTPVEIAALFMTRFTTDAAGLLKAITVISNTLPNESGSRIKNVTLFNDATAVNICVASNQAF